MRADSNSAAAIAADICRRATIIGLQDDANAVATLVQASALAVEEPIPMLPVDPLQRSQLLMRLLIAERARCRKLLALLAD